MSGSFISHINTLVVPGEMGLAMELIMLPLVQRLMEGKKSNNRGEMLTALRLSGPTGTKQVGRIKAAPPSGITCYAAILHTNG